jgi:hypothetical protein
MTPFAKHTIDQLVIIIPTKCPESLHQSLSIAIVTAIKSHLNNTQKCDRDGEYITPLLELQKALLPDENGIKKVYSEV